MAYSKNRIMNSLIELIGDGQDIRKIDGKEKVDYVMFKAWKGKVLTVLYNINFIPKYVINSIEEWYDNSIEGRDFIVAQLYYLSELIENDSLEIEYSNPKEKDIDSSSNKIFIVHGHDNSAKESVARFLMKLKLEPIILNEMPDDGMTIIEKIERFSDVSYAVVLYTGCDLGKEASSEELKKRARQNVVFEHGLLYGKLGRNRVTALVKGNIDTPSDINGVMYVSMDENDGWKQQLAKNMKECGLNIDLNDLL